MISIDCYKMYGHLRSSKRVLISGCGGGYDVFCGLDLMFNLLDQGKHVVLGSYTFTKSDLLMTVGKQVTESCYKVDNTCEFKEKEYIDEIISDVNKLPKNFFECVKMSKEQYVQMCINEHSERQSCYFPEFKLVNGLVTYGLNVPIYCFLGSGGIKHLIDDYNAVIKLEDIDTVILVDGGTDSLMTGVEKDNNGESQLGTPYEDVSSIIAVKNSNARKTFLYCLGFNVDRYHGVTDENFLLNTSDLIKEGYFIGSYMLNKRDETTRMYIDIFMRSDPENSIINSHVVSAIQGHFGNYCPDWLKHRLGNSEQYIHPLMGLYWIYSMDGVYEKLKYDVDKLKETMDEYSVSQLLKL